MKYTMPYSEDFGLWIPTQCTDNVHVLAGNNFPAFMDTVSDVTSICITTTEDYGTVEWFAFTLEGAEHLLAHARRSPDGDPMDFALAWRTDSFRAELIALLETEGPRAFAHAVAFAGNAAEHALNHAPTRKRETA